MLDDQTVNKDLTALDGTGGSTYIGYLLSAMVALRDNSGTGYDSLRRLIQRVPHNGAVTVTITPWRDGMETGQTITRTLGTTDNVTVTAPFNIRGSVFQFKLSLATFDAPAALGSAAVTGVPGRSTR